MTTSTERTRLRSGIELVTAAEGRYYVVGPRRYWSVTWLLNQALAKPALIGWAAKQTAIGAIRLHDTIDKLIEAERDELATEAAWGTDDKPKTHGAKAAYSLLWQYRFQSRDEAANRGSRLHAAAEAEVLGQPWPEPTDGIEEALFEHFRRFLADWKPEYWAAEAPCFSESEHYAGRLDAIATIGGETVLLDYKTSANPDNKGPYPEVGLQLAAYRYADTYIALPDGEAEPLPEIDRAMVLKVTPAYYKLIPIRADEQMWRYFLYAREMARFEVEDASTVVGDALPVPGEEGSA